MFSGGGESWRGGQMVPLFICSSICKGVWCRHLCKNFESFHSWGIYWFWLHCLLDQGVDSSGDVYRATYSAFRCEKASGTLGIQERMQVGVWMWQTSRLWQSYNFLVTDLSFLFCKKVPFTFLPRDQGDYAQFWDLECHPTAKPQHKSRVRFQLCGTVSLINAESYFFVILLNQSTKSKTFLRYAKSVISAINCVKREGKGH